MSAPDYFLPAGYVARRDPAYWVDDHLSSVSQPDLYPEAATLARRLGAHRVIDIGCGTASKLATLHPEFDVVGIDYGSNIEACRDRYHFGTWIDRDLDASDDLGYEDVARSVLVCGDVIEHLVHPERLLRVLRTALDAGAAALLLSTPDRELYYGPDHAGPPPNPSHVREWTCDELRQFMASAGLTGFFGLTRSNDVVPYLRTILAAIPGKAPDHVPVMHGWFEERERWQNLALQQDRMIAELERWAQETLTARDWAEEQRARWESAAERASARILELEDEMAARGTGEDPGPADIQRTAIVRRRRALGEIRALVRRRIGRR